MTNRVLGARGQRIACSFVISFLVCSSIHCAQAPAQTVPVRHLEGVSHGFLIVRTLEGETLASGDLVQTVTDHQVTTEVAFHFKDGSLQDETAVFSQEGSFRLLSDHLVQKGPSFPNAIDILIDATRSLVTLHTSNHGKEKDETRHMDLPPDVANGMVLALVRNLSPAAGPTTVSYLAASSKPRLVKLFISSAGNRKFSVAGRIHEATDFDIKVEIGGVAGVMAPLLGKKPSDIHVWISKGTAPTFVRSEQSFYEGGPIWRTELADLRIEDHDVDAPAPSERKNK